MAMSTPTRRPRGMRGVTPCERTKTSCATLMTDERRLKTHWEGMNCQASTCLCAALLMKRQRQRQISLSRHFRAH